MDADQLIQLGHLNRSHGLKGGIKATVTEVYANQFKNLTHIFIKKGEDFLPFFIAKFEGWQQNSCILYFDDVNTREEAETIHHSAFFAAQELIDVVVEVNELDTWLDNTIVLANGETLGHVVEVQELPQQVILQIETPKGIVPIPITEEFLVEYNEEEKTIVMELPEGYLDIFLT